MCRATRSVKYRFFLFNTPLLTSVLRRRSSTKAKKAEWRRPCGQTVAVRIWLFSCRIATSEECIAQMQRSWQSICSAAKNIHPLLYCYFYSASAVILNLDFKTQFLQIYFLLLRLSTFSPSVAAFRRNQPLELTSPRVNKRGVVFQFLSIVLSFQFLSTASPKMAIFPRDAPLSCQVSGCRATGPLVFTSRLPMGTR